MQVAMAGVAPALTVRGVSKQYELGERVAYRALRDLLSRRPAGARSSRELLWALRDVSFDVGRGEIVGLLGSNGAGKSTMLKLISRITAPTAGEIRVRGRVGSLLEVGTGFHPELTGRENVFLNGAILGMTRREIAARFDEIVEFSELPTFIDTPVKHYSVGMYMRLAFSVAAHLDTELLIIDEVLAVGDVRFQQKCLGRVAAAATSGRTVLFVSHNADVTRRLCTRGLLFERGRLLADGPIDAVVGEYLRSAGVRATPCTDIDLGDVPREGTGHVRATSVWFRGEGPGGTIRTGDRVEVRVRLRAANRRAVRSVALFVSNEQGALLVASDSQAVRPSVEVEPAGTEVTLAWRALPLAAGRYRVDLRVADPITGRLQSGAHDYIERAFELDVRPPEGAPPATHAAAVDVPFDLDQG